MRGGNEFVHCRQRKFAEKGNSMCEIDALLTEQINGDTRHIDRVDTLAMVRLLCAEDAKVAPAVAQEAEHIAQAIDVIYEHMCRGGRLVYCGAGTSGRLGVLDAVECRPTYGVTDGVVIGLMAGGEDAMFRAKEGAEDDAALGETDLRALGFCEADVLVGIAASGRTPYVLGAAAYAHSLGSIVIGLCCNPDSALHAAADITIAPQPGPEAVSGSTRMKAGTAQKMVLNMLSTGAMIRLGKVYENLMVDVQATNEKLRRRAENLVCAATGATREAAKAALEASGGNVKKSIVCVLCGCTVQQAEHLLQKSGGSIHRLGAQ